MDEALLRTLTPTVIGVLVRRGAPVPRGVQGELPPGDTDALVVQRDAGGPPLTRRRTAVPGGRWRTTWLAPPRKRTQTVPRGAGRSTVTAGRPRFPVSPPPTSCAAPRASASPSSGCWRPMTCSRPSDDGSPRWATTGTPEPLGTGGPGAAAMRSAAGARHDTASAPSGSAVDLKHYRKRVIWEPSRVRPVVSPEGDTLIWRRHGPSPPAVGGAGGGPGALVAGAASGPVTRAAAGPAAGPGGVRRSARPRRRRRGSRARRSGGRPPARRPPRARAAGT